MTIRCRAAVGRRRSRHCGRRAGIELLSERIRRECESAQSRDRPERGSAAGIGGIEPQDKAVEQDGQICYGAIGVGGLKMKLHKAAIRRLFESQ